MKAKELSHGNARSWCLAFSTGDDPSTGLLRFAREEGLQGASFTAIGAFSEVTLAFFDWKRKEYESIPVREQVEVVSLVGNLATEDGGDLRMHAHVVVARRDGSTLGGHLMNARVRPTLEVILTEAPETMRRFHDPETGLALLDGSATHSR
jgi:predicted DNA-binding protein with PD1-like motif